MKKIKVIFEQYAIPHYRVPFFSGLAKKTDLLVIASKSPKKNDGINDILNPAEFRSIRLESNPDSGLYHPEIIEVIKKENPDLIISWGSSLRLMLSNKSFLSLIREKGIKTAWMGCDGYDVHNFIIGALLQFLPRRILRTLRDLLITRRVDRFIAHSSHMLNFLRLVKWIPENKITLVNNAINTSDISSFYKKWKTEQRSRKKYGIVFIGRLVPRKNIERLIEAFSYIAPKYPESTLLIIGEGSFEKNLKNLVRNLNIGDKVK